MSEWTHSICRRCWAKREPDRAPAHLKDDGTQVCCFCGSNSDEGIYLRHDPNDLLCGGKHKVED